MADLELQKFINEHKLASDRRAGFTSSIKQAHFDLRAKFNLDIKPQLICYGTGEVEKAYIYNATKNSPMDYKICREANGVILNKYGIMVSRNIPHMYELDDKVGANKMDWETAAGEVWHDGTPVVLYTRKNELFVQTMQHVCAENPLAHCGTYRHGVKTLLNYMFAERPYKQLFEKDTCYHFEFCGQQNKNVTHYNSAVLYLISAVDKFTNKFLKREELDDIVVRAQQLSGSKHIARPEMFPTRTAISAVNLLPSLDFSDKGIIISNDTNDTRIKIRAKSHIMMEEILKKSDKYISPKDAARVVLHPTWKTDLKSDFAKYHDQLSMMGFVVGYAIRNVSNHVENYVRCKMPEDKRIQAITEFNKEHELLMPIFMKVTNKPSDLKGSEYIKNRVKEVLKNDLRKEPGRLVEYAKDLMGKNFEAVFKE